MTKSEENYGLDQLLYRFNGTEPFTIRHAVEGVKILGGIGSGKTTGSGAALAKAYLKAGFGGLVLCAKKDELQTWKHYCKETGRSKRLQIFDIKGKWRFPFLQYEIDRACEGAGYTTNIVRLFMTVYETIEQSRRGSGGDPYWRQAMQQLLLNATDLCLLARGTVSIPMLYKVINSGPRSIDERDSETWREKSLCWKLIHEAGHKPLDKWQGYDYQATLDYWMEDFARLPPKTRASIISMFTSIADNFLRRPFRKLFVEPALSEDHILKPELSLQGAVIIINLPVKEFGEAGRAAQLVYKYMWQQAVERRNLKENNRPVFLWVDEAQNFATEYDMQFQATARSSCACTVYLSQNMPNYYAEMGGAHSKYRVDSLVANLQTKIFHANSDPETNKQAAEIIGRSWQSRYTQIRYRACRGV